ncbi:MULTISPECIES: NADP-dependent oxidoreductase [Micromonospora]|uniref:NADP-dependent oxidoreductase n=1 Tax=Micromonospora solifontis TaxID=2487138 RepID=A0ABX9WAC4_9ACTN|nr:MULTISPECIES: NADP-dependent oxidoreductase [Micromonospora]NES15729.1 NADP-dependent oxidoreductase [Micromonospora sp. PPF5-17B]NES39001.1 NADP-dependent oxidoreductase [Micromonospora solifontis]NES56575.1 NADP-dependent oxidoreductase [Micromonospora sp. PPF5-6]RNL91969.1 NADP-dependent oxidoreductase [Micromonospora solifontis]
MRAVTVRRFGGPEVLEIVDVPLPQPGPAQVRIRVAAAAVNRIDLSTRNGALAKAGLLAPAPQVWLGWDVAGEIDAIGDGVTRFAVGDAVVGLRDILSAPGAQADYVVLDEGAVARAPSTATPAQAATLPLIGLTADRALGLTGLNAGQSLLVTGAAGGVGGLVLELAAMRGIRTVAVAGKEDEELVRRLGAAWFVARTDQLAAEVRRLVPGGVDAVVDAATVGVAAHEALRGAGTFVALVRPFAPPALRGTRVVVQEVYADGARLAELAALVDAGRLTLRVADVLPLAEVATAHERLAAGGLRGRLVLVP